ncbi:MAG: ribose-phosphate diphosphokinase [Candidatus Pacebacteria bacterium]|nr:ribose-phosphate diphosphokinase [Candidatus Paceibacterota bacterium]
MENLVIGDELAKKLAQQLNSDFIFIENRVFPDGEVQPRLEKEKKANKAILIFQKKQEENINAYLIKFFLLLRKVKELAQEIICIMPYFSYARQDSIFQEGEPLSSLYISELIEKDADVFITCNMHEHRKKIGDLFKIPAYNVFLFQDLAEEFKDFSPSNSIVIGPDKESRAFVDDFCKKFPAEKIVFEKTRDVKTGKIDFSFDKNRDFTNKDVIIVDDIVSTGRTILQTAEIVKELKAKTISFAFIHSIFGDKAIEQLNKINPKKIVFTNTLENSCFSVDITKPIAKYILENKLV